ncbi:hypothetical protein [Simiduia agarivorans]|uniref:Membrane protein n=1 Tax=Simiduia agarivorans (strain DSM 21679 / JCM 13881 / BCRC 17597 / SA1) TaxID=1117647 RepID=K4KHD1_SIMAS|nr:hypothetical protein [Simiduia agarivorans]AFU97605.1 membrane protein [Simiduia agarivorans SA1 = DSM 21679]
MDFWAQLPPLTTGLLILISCLSLYFAGPGYNSHSAAQSPAILTSTGIFGTFLGVALGLLHFDTADISASVPQLINGLKTAFWTSIAGLLGALMVKFRHLFAIARQRRRAEAFQAASLTDVANLLTDIHQALTTDEVQGVRAQLLSLKQEQKASFNQLVNQLSDYQAGMARANAEALVKAVDKVMRDFNAEINTQYGENFQALNDAVGKLLHWQESYRHELDALLQAQKANGELLDKAASAYGDMVAHADVFTKVSQSLGDMLAGTESQSKQLAHHLELLAEVSSRAAEGLPAMGEKLRHMTDELADNLARSQREVSENLQAATQALANTSQQVHATLAELASGTDQRVADHLARIERGLEQELVQALKTFGYQMTSLSEKFVNDYTPLTERLRTLIQLAEQANGSRTGTKPRTGVLAD